MPTKWNDMKYAVDWENFVIKLILYGPIFYKIKTHGSFLQCSSFVLIDTILSALQN